MPEGVGYEAEAVQEVAQGASRPEPHPITQRVRSVSTENFVWRRKSRASGRQRASRISLRCGHGAKGVRLARTPVSRVTVIGVVEPREGAVGVTVQRLLVGTPVQAKVTLPVTVGSELRDSW